MGLVHLLQGGDHQGAGLGNLAKIGALMTTAATIASGGEKVAICEIGDMFDAAGQNTTVDAMFDDKGLPAKQEALDREFSEQNPATYQLVRQYMEQAQAGVQDPDVLAQLKEDPAFAAHQQKMKSIIDELKAEESRQLPQIVETFYSTLNDQIGKLDDHVPFLYVDGNHDPGGVESFLTNGTYLSGQGAYEFGGLNIGGLTYTDFEREKLWPDKQIDAAQTKEESRDYQRLSKGSTGENLDVIISHGPPVGKNLRGSTEDKHEAKKYSAGYDALLEEHKPKVVMCGHFDKDATLYFENGTLYARSSIDIMFDHKFDEKTGDWMHTDVYRYKV